MKKIALKGALEKLGCKVVKLEWNGGVASRDQSGFFIGGGQHGFADGQLYYITYSPMFSYCGMHVMYRTAKDLKDYTGGQNTWNFERALERIGYQLSLKAVMPRSKRWC